MPRRAKRLRNHAASGDNVDGVQASFCFINPDGQAGGSGIPLFRTLSVDGFPLFYPRKLSKYLKRPGPLNRESRAVLAEALVELFPSA